MSKCRSKEAPLLSNDPGVRKFIIKGGDDKSIKSKLVDIMENGSVLSERLTAYCILKRFSKKLDRDTRRKLRLFKRDSKNRWLFPEQAGAERNRLAMIKAA